MKLIFLILFILILFKGNSQKIHGFIANENDEALYGAKITCGTLKLTSDWNGRFEIPASHCDTIYFQLTGFESQLIQLSTYPKNSLHVVLKAKVIELKEALIIKNRFENFDIGYLAPIKGVQIATGTNTIIQTENQGGAKSSANPRELFAKVPGLNIWESDGGGIQMGVGGRGLSPNRTANFNTRQNGYDISADALGYPESYYTPPIEALSSIEIIRGSASLQYGTQFGGLMNFIIKDPVKNTPLEITFRNTLGSFGYKGTFLRISGTNKKLEYQSYYQYKEASGYRLNSGYSQHQYFGQIGYHITEYQNIRLEFTKMVYNAQQPGGLTDIQFRQDPTQSMRNRNWFNVDWNLMAIHYNYLISPNTTLNIRSYAIISSRQSLGFLGKITQADPGKERQLIFGDFKNTGTEIRLLKKYEFTLFKTKIKSGSLIGARFYQGKTSALQGTAPGGNSSEYRFLNPSDLENSSFLFPSTNTSLFTENIWFIGDRLTVNMGIRFEHIQSASSGYYKQNIYQPLDTITKRYESTSSLTRNIPLAGIGGSFKVTKQTNLYVNLCMNYRAINFSDIRVTNPNLLVDSNMRDEYGSTFEIGYRGFIKPYIYIDLAAFHLLYGNKIGITAIPNEIKRLRTNIGNAQNIGIESLIEIDFIKAINDSARLSSAIFLNMSYIDAHYIASKEPNFIGKQLEYVSPFLWKTGAKLKGPHWNITIQGSYNSPQFTDASNSISPSGDAVIGEIPAYFVVDMSARITLKKWMTLEGGINNLMNSSYFTRRATAYPGPGILPSDGRSIYATLQFKIGDR
jgi:Fe(3+) dicitrate transport protein